MDRKAYPSDVSDEEWAFVVSYLTFIRKGFALLPRRWVVERSFGWMARFRRLARNYERLPDTLKDLHFLAFCHFGVGELCPSHGFRLVIHNRL